MENGKIGDGLPQRADMIHVAMGDENRDLFGFLDQAFVQGFGKNALAHVQEKEMVALEEERRVVA